jgi:hypothetical protein
MAHCSYGVTQLQYGQPLSDLAPDGSYLQDYDAVQQATYRQQVGEPVGLYFKAGPGQLDVSEPATQARMLAAWDIALQSSYVNASTTAFLGNWLVSFLKWAQDRNQTVPVPMVSANALAFEPTLKKNTCGLRTKYHLEDIAVCLGCRRPGRLYFRCT